MLPRSSLLLLACVLCLGAAATPAFANHWDDEPPPEEVVEEPDWEEPLPPEEAPPAEEPEWDEPAWDEPDADEPDWEDEAPEEEQPPIVTGKTVLGRVARLRADGKAAVPLGAPVRVRRLISAINEIVGKPYKWGGGHARVFDRGYDCSGAVSYGLIRTGLLGSPLDSRGFMRWALPGAGRWVTIYGSRGHAYMEIAGLRLDTSSMGDRDRRSGVRWRQPIGKRRGFRARHLAAL